MGHHVKDCAPEIHELNFCINLAMKAVLAWSRQTTQLGPHSSRHLKRHVKPLTSISCCCPQCTLCEANYRREQQLCALVQVLSWFQGTFTTERLPHTGQISVA